MSVSILTQHLRKIRKHADEIESLSRHCVSDPSYYGARIRSETEDIVELVKKAQAVALALDIE